MHVNENEVSSVAHTHNVHNVSAEYTAIPTAPLILEIQQRNEFSAYVSTCHMDNCNCWPSPSNQSFYRQIAGYQRGVSDHRVD